MCTIIQKYANTGVVNISAANPNLDGTGTMGTVLTAAGTPKNGTKINSVTIKATGNTTEGMVRLFIETSAISILLYKEVYIPANTVNGVTEAFQTTVYGEITLDPGQALLASTQNAESFNILADGSDWQNCACTDDCNCSDQRAIAHTGLVNIATANPHLDGSGAIGTLITAPTGTLFNGTQVGIVDIKAIVTTLQGMVRVFVNNGSTNFLVWEVPIPGTTQTGVQPAYRTQCLTGITLQAGYSIGVSTQNANSINVLTFASDVTNCPCE